MSSTTRFLLSFLLGASLIILLSACGGGDFPEEDAPEKTNQPVHCHPPTFVGPQPKECY